MEIALPDVVVPRWLLPKGRCERFAVQPDGSVRRISDEEFLRIGGHQDEAAAWRQGSSAKAVLGWLGAWGCETSKIEDDLHLCDLMETICGIEFDSVARAHKWLAGARENVRKHAIRTAVKLGPLSQNYKLFPKFILARR